MFLSPYAEFCVPTRCLILYLYIHKSMTSLAVLNEQCNRNTTREVITAHLAQHTDAYMKDSGQWWAVVGSGGQWWVVVGSGGQWWAVVGSGG